eukprot:2094966-Pyramimonas_sp.AAC.1
MSALPWQLDPSAPGAVVMAAAISPAAAPDQNSIVDAVPVVARGLGAETSGRWLLWGRRPGATVAGP